MDRDGVLRWVDRYERAWREVDLDAIATLFTEDARYRPSPYEESLVGHGAIREFWPEGGEPFAMSAAPIAVEGDDAVVRVLVQYGIPVRQEYRDLWVLHFVPDGRVDDFEEWAYWPGRPYAVGGG